MDNDARKETTGYVPQDTSIKVTPEMIGAGKAAEREWTKLDRTVERMVWIYRAMESARAK